MKFNGSKSKNVTAKRSLSFKEKAINLLLTAPASLLLIIGYCPSVYAAEYSQNFAKFFFDQAFWIVLVVVVILVIKCALARNFIQVGITIVVGLVIAIFIKSPDSFVDIGEKIVTLIKSGS